VPGLPLVVPPLRRRLLQVQGPRELSPCRDLHIPTTNEHHPDKLRPNPACPQADQPSRSTVNRSTETGVIPVVGTATEEVITHIANGAVALHPPISQSVRSNDEIMEIEIVLNRRPTRCW